MSEGKEGKEQSERTTLFDYIPIKEPMKRAGGLLQRWAEIEERELAQLLDNVYTS